MVNFKKGANAYILSSMLLVAGIPFLGVGSLIVWFLPEDSLWTLFLGTELLMGGQVMLTIGLFGLVFSFAGSFFEFETERHLLKIFVGIALVAMITLLYILVIPISGVDVLSQPWNGIFLGLVGIMAFLFFSTFFLHTARKRARWEEQRDFIDRIADAIKKGKVVVFPSKKTH